MKVLIAGGGTAGHINPGLAIAKYLKDKNPDTEIVFVGTKRGLETELVPREGFKLELVRVRGFRRKLSKDTLIAVKELFLGMMDAKKILKAYKPDIVIGTGGYVCGPVLYNASKMGIPTLIHEQNAYPGVTNKILSRYVDKVAISFKEANKYFKYPNKLVLTGNPVRKEMVEINRGDSQQKVQYKGLLGHVVIFGGSLGAQKINSTVTQMLLENYKEEFSILFATGKSQYGKVTSDLSVFKSDKVTIVPYIFDAPKEYAAADLIVCRGGAITTSEMAAIGMPCIMIPSPNVTANHQEHNARSLENQGAAVVILEKDLTSEVLHEQIKKLLSDKEALSKMSRNSKKAGITNASEKIYDIVLELSKNAKK